MNKAGFSSRIIDFNDDLKYVYRNDPETLSMINRFYNDFTYYNKDIYNILESFYDRWARDITVISPKWLGVQVFSFDSYRSARLLALKVKELNPKQKIVFGGAGRQVGNLFEPELGIQTSRQLPRKRVCVKRTYLHLTFYEEADSCPTTVEVRFMPETARRNV